MTKVNGGKTEKGMVVTKGACFRKKCLQGQLGTLEKKG